MSLERNLVPERVARGEATIDEIRSDLAARCAEIPYAHWQKRREFYLTVGRATKSSLPEGEDSKIVRYRLNRNGTMTEHWIHTAEVGLIIGDEYLGEADESSYRKCYSDAVEEIDRQMKPREGGGRWNGGSF